MFSKTSVHKVSPPSLSRCPCLGFHLIPNIPIFPKEMHMCFHFHPLLLCKYLELVHQVKQRCISLQASPIYVPFTFVSCTNSVSIAVSTEPFRCFCLPYLCVVWLMVPSGKEGGRCSCIQQVATFKSQGSKHRDAYASPVPAALYLHFISAMSVLLRF